ncbi:MAG: EipB family protein [Aestuariivirga sp.]
MGFDLYANGVATGLVLDYGDFALGGELAQMELLKSDSCP